MPRRRRSRPSQPSNFEFLLTLPWWGRGLLGIAVFAGLRLAAVSLSASPFTRALAPMLTVLGNLALLFFGAAALIGLIGQILDQRRWASSKLGPAGAPIRRDPSLRREAFKSDAVWLSTQPLPVHSEEGSDVSPVASTPPLSAWSLELLREMEWKRFEELCAAYYRSLGFTAQTIRRGADGGVDVTLYQAGSAQAHAIVQCKAWNTQSVGVKPVRELLGVMTSEKVAQGIFMATGTFTQEALMFARANSLELIDGPGLMARLRDLSGEMQQRLLDVAMEEDYKVPTCPSCGIKMVRREGGGGRKPFWGCTSFSRVA